MEKADILGQNYSLVEQKRMSFDILINFWWKYQVYKYFNLSKNQQSMDVDQSWRKCQNWRKIKIDENVKIDEKILNKRSKFDENVKYYLNFH